VKCTLDPILLLGAPEDKSAQYLEMGIQKDTLRPQNEVKRLSKRHKLGR
jgi:hypothetical protein